jgi:oxaloacetate decarboxylase beta subunit
MNIVQIITDNVALLNMTFGQYIMIGIACMFLYLSVGKKCEPLLLLPLAFGILVANFPIAGLHAYYFNPNEFQEIAGPTLPGLMNVLYNGIRLIIYPPLVFLCIGTMTDFTPLIASPRLALIGIGGQLGIFVAMTVSFVMGNFLAPYFPGFDGFTWKEAASIGIIGSSDGPTSIFAATRLAPDLLSAVAIAAFSYMALVPFIQPPIMRLLTTDKERVIVMPPPRKVSQREKILFPIWMTVLVLLLVPQAGILISMLMLGNLIRESGVAERFVHTFQNDLINILTFVIAFSIGTSATADRFLTVQTLVILFCGLLAFATGTVGGVLVAKLMCKMTGGKVNPLIGNSGVSAMPMAARISQKLGQQYNQNNFLLMHAMGPIVSSTIGSAIIAGVFIAFFK